MRRITFLTPNKTALISSSLKQAILAWAKDWCFDNSTCEVQYISKNTDISQFSNVVANDTCSPVGIWVLDLDEGLRTQVFGKEMSQQVPDDSLAEQLISRAKIALAIAITEAANKDIQLSVSATELVQQEHYNTDSGIGDHNAVFNISINTYSFSVAIDLSLCSPTKPQPSLQGGRLITSNDYKNLNNTVSAKISIPFGKQKLVDITNLSKGDVIVSDHNIRKSLPALISNQAFANVTLGRNQKNKVLTVEKLIHE